MANSDALNALLSKYGGGPTHGFSGPSTQTNGTKRGSQTPLDWLLDIADRPRRAITQVVEAGAHAAIDMANGHFDPAKSIGEGLSAIPRGLFSTNPTDQETFSQELNTLSPQIAKTQLSHDVTQTLTGKQYTNKSIDDAFAHPSTAMNVLSGVGGFVGDVGLDPLTYVPGLDVVKGAKIAVGALRGGEDALKGRAAAKGIVRALAPGTEKMKTAVFGAEEAAKGPQIADLLGTAASESEKIAPTPTSAEVQNLVNPDAPVEYVPPPVLPSESVKNNAQAHSVLDFLKTVQDPSAFKDALNKVGEVHPIHEVTSTEDTVKAAEKEIASGLADLPTPIKPEPLSKQNWSKQIKEIGAAHDASGGANDAVEQALTLSIPGHAKDFSYLHENLFSKDPKVQQAVKGKYEDYVAAVKEHAVYGKKPDALGMVPDAGPAALPEAPHATSAAGTALPSYHPRQIALDQHLAAGDLGDPVRFQAKTAELQRAVDEAAKTSTTHARLTQLMGTDEGKFFVEQHIGDAMARTFLKSDPASLDAAIERVRTIASGDPSLDTMNVMPTVGTPERDLLTHLGMGGRDTSPMAMATSRREWQAIHDGVAPGTTPGVSDSRTQLLAVQKAAGNSQTKIGAQFEGERAALKGLQGLLGKDLKIDPAEYKFRSEDGLAAKTAEEAGAGSAKRGNRIDSHVQYSLVRRIRDHVNAVMDRQYRSVDVQTARKLRAQMELKAQYLAYSTLDSAGAPIAMTFRDAAGNETMASLTKLEAYEQLAGSPAGKELMDFLFFGRGSLVADTSFMEGIARLVRGDSMDDVMSTIVSEKITGNGKRVPNWLSTTDTKVYAQVRKMAQKNGILPERPAWVTHTAQSGPNLNYVAHPADAAAMLRGLLEGNRDALKGIASQNAQGLLRKVTDDTLTMTKAELSNLDNLLQGNNLAAFIVGLRDMPTTVAHMAHAGSAVPVSAEMTSAAVTAALPEHAVEDSTRAAHMAAMAERTPAEHQRAAEASYRAAAESSGVQDANLREALAQGGPEADGVIADDLDLTGWEADSDKAYSELNRSFLSVFDPAKKYFSATYALQGKVDAWRIKHDVGVNTGWLIQRTRTASNEAQRQFGHMSTDGKHTYLDLGFKAWQNGTTPVDETTAGALQAVQGIMEGLAEGGPNKSITRILNSRIFSTTSNYEYMNTVLSRYDGTRGFVFDIERAEQEALRSKSSLGEAVARQISEWDVKDVPAFFDSMNQASIKMVSDGAIAERFVTKAREMGAAWDPVHSSGPKPKNYVRVIATGKTDLAPFLPQDLHLDKETAWLLKRLDNVMQESTQLGDSPFARVVKNVFDPALQAWKRAATVLHPGHHVRNDIGDASMQYADAGLRHAGAAQKAAIQMLYKNKDYDGVDILKSLESMGITALDQTGKKLTTGHYGSFTHQDLFQAAMDRGLLADTKTIESFEQTSNRGAYQTLLRTLSLQGDSGVLGKIDKTVSGISEYRDHDSVLRHFVQKVMKANDDGFVDGVSGKIKVAKGDYNAMFDAIANDVIKAHPNRTLLSNFERKYVARVIPFYTWMRGALPFVINSSARYPGRALALPRAQFALATAMGVNPQSLSDPFPQGSDAQFPSFIKDQIVGPTFRGSNGDYFSMSPGITQFDVPNTFLGGGNPAGAVLGMLNPFIKAPLELATGKQLATGGAIHDTSDYIDSQVPALQYLSNFTGISPTGSVASEITGRGLDAQYQVAKGDKSAGLAQILGASNPNVGIGGGRGRMTQSGAGTDQLISLINALTGAGVANDSKQSYRTIAANERTKPTAF